MKGHGDRHGVDVTPRRLNPKSAEVSADKRERDSRTSASIKAKTDLKSQRKGAMY